MDTDERFDLLDYLVFGGMLGASALIGVYFAFCAKKKQNTTDEYLMGGKSMGTFPMSMSLVASNISGISLIGLPSEMYTFGTQLWISLYAETFSYILNAFAFLPVLHNLQVTSSYEYLERRYNSTLRKMGSALFLIGTMMYIPIVIYVPALAFAQVTGLSLFTLIPLVCVVCIFYTTLGGLKAVVWTDTLQTMLILLGVAVVAILGTINAGGFLKVWETSSQGGRIEFFNMDFDPTVRHTFINVFLGKFFHNLSIGTTNQSIVQRYLAMPTLKKARLSIWILIVGMLVLVSFCNYTGLVVYAAFHDCDPVMSKRITKSDQILPYFILKTASHIPALPGIFVAGVFSAALSTMSTCLNSMTAVIMEDFIRPSLKKPISEARASFYMKVMVVLIGSVTVALSLVVDKLGGIVQTSSSFGGITAGTLLGMFLLGTLFPFANSAGALAGAIASSLFVGWISLGTQWAIAQRQITFTPKPVSIEGCDNTTLAHLQEIINESPPIFDPLDFSIVEPFVLYRVSYVYYPVIGTVVCIFVGLIVSRLTGMNGKETVDPELLSPFVRKFYTLEEDDIVNNSKTKRKNKSNSDIKPVRNDTRDPLISPEE